MKSFFLFLIIVGLFCSALLGQEIYFSHLQTVGPVKITIAPGLGSRKIGDLLKSEGVIRSKWAFVTYVSLRGEASALLPGEYSFDSEAIPTIAAKLTHGGGNETVLVFPEGWNVRDVGVALEQEGLFSREEFFSAAGRPAMDYSALGGFVVIQDLLDRFPFLREKSARVGLEGYLFPDTYRFFKKTTPQEVVVKMLENFDRKVTPDLRAQATAEKKSLFAIITMASVIEKEVRSDEDRAIISGILWKRLTQNMPLQVDATIVYITGKRGMGVSTDDTFIDSPYNTYRNPGLPLGPIANPGLSAIRAALNPKDSPYLYYLSTPSGKTIFSKTFEEHVAAKAKYLQ